MRDSRIYGFLSDFYALLSKYDPDTISGAIQKIQSHADTDPLVSSLATTLQGSQPRLDRDEERANQPEQDRPVVSPSLSVDEEHVREIQAMLADRDFLPTNKELCNQINRSFNGKRSFNLSPKDARERIEARAVRAFQELSPQDRRSVYASLRQGFLRRRKSTLGEWTDVITRTDR